MFITGSTFLFHHKKYQKSNWHILSRKHLVCCRLRHRLWGFLAGFQAAPAPQYLKDTPAYSKSMMVAPSMYIALRLVRNCENISFPSNVKLDFDDLINDSSKKARVSLHISAQNIFHCRWCCFAVWITLSLQHISCSMMCSFTVRRAKYDICTQHDRAKLWLLSYENI